MYQTAGSMGTLARDKSVTPGVACLTDGTLTDGVPMFAKPGFRLCVPFC